MSSDKFWRGKKFAHIFDHGWDIGNFNRAKSNKSKTGPWTFNYPDGEPYGHSLDLDEHGLTKSWVVIRKLK